MAVVVSVNSSDRHGFSKKQQQSIRLVAGHGVEGDAHAGVTVQHLSRQKKEPDLPNLRQVHLLHAELFEELADKGFVVGAGDMGENITTCDIDLLSLPLGTLLHIGEEAVVEVTGLRNPCRQIDGFQKGLMAETLEKREDGSLLRKTGIMSIVIKGGPVRAGDAVRVELPAEPFEALPVV